MKTEGTVRSGGWQCSGYSLCVPGKIKIFPPYLRARLAESRVPQTREPFQAVVVEDADLSVKVDAFVQSHFLKSAAFEMQNLYGETHLLQ